MKVKQRSFPYPVMSAWGDDVSPYDLSVTYEEIRFDKFYYYLPYSVSVGNETIQQLIASGAAGYALHVECRGAFFREVFWISENPGELILPGEQLEGRVEVNLFICARKEIPNYAPAGIHEDYMGVSVNLKSGDFLVMGPTLQFDAYKDYDPIQKISSIIAFDPDPDRNEGGIKINYYGEKLVALVPKKLHEKYELLKKQIGGVAPSVLSSLLVLPILMEGCRHIKQEKAAGLDDYKDRRWARILEKRGEDLKIDFISDDPYEMAQKILGDPYSRTCAELSILGGSEK